MNNQCSLIEILFVSTASIELFVFFFNGKQIDKIQNAIFRVSCIFRPLFHLFREYKGPQMNSNGGQQTEKHEKCPSVFGVCVQFGCFRGCETPVFFFKKTIRFWGYQEHLFCWKLFEDFFRSDILQLISVSFPKVDFVQRVLSHKDHRSNKIIFQRLPKHKIFSCRVDLIVFVSNVKER